MAEGIDVSHWQGSINWGQVAAAGISFAWIKATEGTTYSDPRWSANRAAAAVAGVPWGGYHFARCASPAVTQADRFVQAGGMAGPLPGALDLETADGIGPTGVAEWAVVFCQRVEALTGRVPVFYTYLSFAKAIGDDPRLARYPLWLARYGPQPPTIAPWPAWSVWQYTSDGTVPGVKGRCDRNTCSDATLAGLLNCQEDDLDATERGWLSEVTNYVRQRSLPDYDPTERLWLSETTQNVRELEAAVAALTAKVDELLAHPGNLGGLSFDEVTEAARLGAEAAEDT